MTRHANGGGWGLRAALVGLLGAAVGLTAIALPAAAAAQPQNVKVLSRNLYLGSDVVGLATAPDLPAFRQAAGETWDMMVFTNFVARAKVLADEVDDRKPHAIGLQEVTMWRRGPVGDPQPARSVAYNFMQQLRAELRRRGLRYQVALIQRQFDVEGPTDKGFDARLTVFDAILTRRGLVKVQRTRSGTYDARLTLPTAIGPIEIPRGFVQANLRVRGKLVRVVNTHLEAFSAEVRAEQANELIASGALSARRPVILVGDLNSDPASPTPGSNAYNNLIADGFVDRGVRVNTCCHAEDLLNPTPDFGSRIDHVLTKPPQRLLAARLLGADPSMRTPLGLWPSDHGGAFSRLRVR